MAKEFKAPKVGTRLVFTRFNRVNGVAVPYEAVGRVDGSDATPFGHIISMNLAKPGKNRIIVKIRPKNIVRVAP